jgi:hypothetical protein
LKAGDNHESFSSDIKAQEPEEDGRQLSTSKRQFGDETEHESKQDRADSRAIELRRRNAIYSKRKYDKKKNEVEQLIQTRCDLEAENRQLIEENTGLTSLLALAQAKANIEESSIMQVLKKSRTSPMKNRQSHADIIGAPSSLLSQLTLPHGHAVLNLPSHGGVPVLSSSAQLDHLLKSNMLGDPLTSRMGPQERQKKNPLHFQQYLQSYEQRSVNQLLPPNNLQQNELTHIPALTYTNIGHVQRSVAESSGLRLWDNPLLSATQNISGGGANIALNATQLQILLSRSNEALHPTNMLDLLTASSAQNDTLNATQSVVENLVARGGQSLQQRQGQKQQQQLSDTDALIEYLRRRKRQHDDPP